MNDTLTTAQAIIIVIMSLAIGGLGTIFLNRWLKGPEECDGKCAEELDPEPEYDHGLRICVWGTCEKPANIIVNDRDFCDWDHVPMVWRKP